MIPHGRPALDLDSVAQRAGVSPSTFGRRHAKAFRAAVKPLPGSKRPLLYDAGQVDAHLAGKPVPELPTEPDPSDLLTDAEAGVIAGVTPSTIRSDATTGLIAPGRELYGRRWWTRAEAEARATRQPQHKGRTPGATDKTPRSRRPKGPTADDVAAELKRAGAARGQVDLDAIAARYGVSRRTVERAIAASHRPGKGTDLIKRKKDAS
ncbi:DNA-binding protein [Streptomyces griseus]|uniref:DNA-binding protein n=1 Tax=Streptomyces griseus TaxID=1911 RepID=UPI0036611717